MIFIGAWSLFFLMFGLAFISGVITYLVMSGIFSRKVERLEEEIEEANDEDRSS